jgi:hypothetical protein
VRSVTTTEYGGDSGSEVIMYSLHGSLARESCLILCCCLRNLSGIVELQARTHLVLSDGAAFPGASREYNNV